MNEHHSLIIVPFSRQSGFAIDSLVDLFTSSTRAAFGHGCRISVVYGDSIQSENGQHTQLDGLHWERPSNSELETLSRVLSESSYSSVLGLDIPVASRAYSLVRKSGVSSIVAYYGAPMSSENSGPKLLAKRLEMALRSGGPDHYVFETQSMRRSATHGRGIRLEKTSVVSLGTDLTKFRPDTSDALYAHAVFGIPRDRHLVFYSGHFEERKGVAVLVRAARELVEVRGRSDIHFLLLGNRQHEERPFTSLLEGTPSIGHVTFGGYRNDLERLHRSCSLGAIASTGWDSMTVSSVEMAASGLPLLVSDLQGLPETVESGRTGFTFPPGNHKALADLVEHLIDDDAARLTMSRNARARAESLYSRDDQVLRLASILSEVYASRSRRGR